MSPLSFARRLPARLLAVSLLLSGLALPAHASKKKTVPCPTIKDLHDAYDRWGDKGGADELFKLLVSNATKNIGAMSDIYFLEAVANYRLIYDTLREKGREDEIEKRASQIIVSYLMKDGEYELNIDNKDAVFKYVDLIRDQFMEDRKKGTAQAKDLFDKLLGHSWEAVEFEAFLHFKKLIASQEGPYKGCK